MSEFFHIYIRPKADVTRDQIQEKLNLAISWFRYDDKCWIVYTTSNAKKWYARLEEFVEPGGNIFVCKFDVTSYWGFMSKKLWAWIRKHKSSS